MQPTGKEGKLRMLVWRGDLIIIRFIHTYFVDTNKTPLLHILRSGFVLKGLFQEKGDLMNYSSFTRLLWSLYLCAFGKELRWIRSVWREGKFSRTTFSTPEKQSWVVSSDPIESDWREGRFWRVHSEKSEKESSSIRIDTSESQFVTAKRPSSSTHTRLLTMSWRSEGRFESSHKETCLNESEPTKNDWRWGSERREKEMKDGWLKEYEGSESEVTVSERREGSDDFSVWENEGRTDWVKATLNGSASTNQLFSSPILSTTRESIQLRLSSVRLMSSHEGILVRTTWEIYFHPLLSRWIDRKEGRSIHQK